MANDHLDRDSLGAAFLDETVSFSEALDRAVKEIGGTRPEPRPPSVWRTAASRMGFIAVLPISVVATLLAAHLLGEPGGLTAPEALITLVLSLVPAWLYLRFVTVRLDAVWSEYVLNLHRLGVDRPEYLPQPPKTSIYRRVWERAGGDALVGRRNIYEDKFVAMYGVGASQREGYRVRPGIAEMAPVLVAVGVFALGWTAVFEGSSLASDTVSLEDGLRLAFVGAYAFVLHALLRRFYQSDLRASSYASAVVRIITACALVVILNWIWPLEDQGTLALVASFCIGAVPLVGLQFVSHLTWRTISRLLPGSRTPNQPYDLRQLDGMKGWDEARLRELGIEDLVGLVSANLVDLVLHTRVPVGRLVDWVDQAILYLHLDHPSSSVNQPLRETLHRLGIRTATDFEQVFSSGAPNEVATRSDVAKSLGISRPAVEALLALLAADLQMKHVRAWKQDWRELSVDAPEAS